MDTARLFYFLSVLLTAGGVFFLLSDEPVTRGTIEGLDTQTVGLVLVVPGLLLLAWSLWRRTR